MASVYQSKAEKKTVKKETAKTTKTTKKATGKNTKSKEEKSEFMDFSPSCDTPDLANILQNKEQPVAQNSVRDLSAKAAANVYSALLIPDDPNLSDTENDARRLEAMANLISIHETGEPLQSLQKDKPKYTMTMEDFYAGENYKKGYTRKVNVAQPTEVEQNDDDLKPFNEDETLKQGSEFEDGADLYEDFRDEFLDLDDNVSKRFDAFLSDRKEFYERMSEYYESKAESALSDGYANMMRKKAQACNDMAKETNNLIEIDKPACACSGNCQESFNQLASIFFNHILQLQNSSDENAHVACITLHSIMHAINYEIPESKLIDRVTRLLEEE